MSILRTYQTARLALQAQTAAMNTAGQNVANAGVEGYSRRRLTLQTLPQANNGIWSRNTSMGLSPGVTVQSITRVRDELLANAARDARAGLGGADEQYRGLSALESMLGTTDAGALPDVLGQFWNSFNDLANSPTDKGVRRAVLGHGKTVADTLHRMDDNLRTLGGQLQEDLGAGLKEANALLDGIARANEAINKARATGAPDLEAEDERDRLVDQLSALAPIRVHRDAAQGDYTISLNNHALVSRTTVTHLELDAPAGGPVALRLQGTNVNVSMQDGRIGARLNLLTTVLPGAQQTLDTFAADLVTALNAQHAQGDDLNGAPGGDFFDPLGVTARTISVALTNPDALAAAATGQPAGDTTNALALAGLRAPFEKGAIDFLSGIGAQVQQAGGETRRLEAVTSHLEALEKGVSGVSLDEEMTRLIEHQQAYQAAARVLTTAQTMMDTLLSL